MISSIASAYTAAAEHGRTEPHLAWRLAWQRLKDDWKCGQRPVAQDLCHYLEDVPPEDRGAAAIDLISEHLHLTWQAGCGLTLDDYVAGLADECPWLTESASVPADLVEDEFVARSTPPYGDQPMLARYLARFPNRPDVMRRLAGRCLGNNRYVRLRVLGVGHLGVVHQAYDRVGQRLVAVKEAPCLPLGDDTSQLLLQESKLTAELDHPNIVSLYDVGRSANGVFYVMAFIEGQTLSEHIRDYHGGRMNRSSRENRRLLHELIDYVIQVCDGVDHAHERGILHRDIKPGNVIVDDSGHATIVDWGLARRLAHAAGHAFIVGLDAIVGTPQYMAPEQAAGREEPASDIFSLGAMLCEAMVGRPPHDWTGGALPCDWKETVRKASFAPLMRQIRVPPQLKSILAKALARSPSCRQASAAALAEELRSFLSRGSQSGGWFSMLFSAS